MTHAQQQILDAVAAALVNGNTAAGSRVFVDRVDPLRPPELPAILVHEAEEGEQAEVFYQSGEERRVLSVSVDCVLGGNTAPAAVRAFGLAVEKILTASTALRGLSKLGLGMTNSRMEISGESEQLLAARRQSWRFVYLVHPSAPDVIL